MTKFVLDPDDPLYEDPTIPRPVTRRRLAFAGKKPTPQGRFGQTPIEWITDRSFDWVYEAKARLWNKVLIMTKHGERTEVPISSADVSDLGLDRHYKVRLLRQFAEHKLIILMLDGNSTSRVSVHPRLLPYLRSRRKP
jgi:hypothetical protein